MKPTALPRRRGSKVERVRVYTRFSPPLRKHLDAYSKATGRSERAVMEEAVARYLANPDKDPSTSGPLDRLAQAIDDDRRLHERQHRDLEILSEAFGQFLRLWTIVHGPTFRDPATPEAAGMVSKQQAAGEALYKRFAAKVAGQFHRGHRFLDDLPGLGGSRPPRDGKE
jgi:predicted transcriptional regulator